MLVLFVNFYEGEMVRGQLRSAEVKSLKLKIKAEKRVDVMYGIRVTHADWEKVAWFWGGELL